MQYLCLVYASEAKLNALPAGEHQALVDASMDYMDELRKNGHYLAANALQSVQTATTVRVENGRTLTTDGPFAETKEQLGGFILIEAQHLDDAVQIASKFPPVRRGVASMEVRPIRELTHS